MPHCGIQSTLSTNWKPACASSQPRRTPSETTNVISETARPKPLMAPLEARGKKARTIAPAIGSQRKVLSNGINGPRTVGSWQLAVGSTPPPRHVDVWGLPANCQLSTANSDSYKKCDEYENSDKE